MQTDGLGVVDNPLGRLTWGLIMAGAVGVLYAGALGVLALTLTLVEAVL